LNSFLGGRKTREASHAEKEEPHKPPTRRGSPQCSSWYEKKTGFQRNALEGEEVLRWRSLPVEEKKKREDAEHHKLVQEKKGHKRRKEKVRPRHGRTPASGERRRRKEELERRADERSVGKIKKKKGGAKQRENPALGQERKGERDPGGGSN